MPGPFPGMDPYLENHWGDVHTSLTTYARNQLQPQLPTGLRARVEEHVQVESAVDSSVYRPDVSVTQHSPSRQPGSPTAVLEGISEELIVDLLEPETERYVQIVDVEDGGRIITSLEFLSPGNKDSQQARERFQSKQHDLLAAGVNLVEVDLIRSGGWVLSVPEREIPAAYRYPYRACVRRAIDPAHAICYRAALQDRLPVVRVPLRPEDADVRLDIQLLIDQAWRDGGYDTLDYRTEPPPPLSESDLAWIRECVQSWRKV